MLISYNLYIWTISKVLEWVSLRCLLKVLLHKMQAAVIAVLLILFYLLVYIKFSWCYDSFPQITLEVISVIRCRWIEERAVCTVGSTLSMTVTASLHSWRFSVLAVFFYLICFSFCIFRFERKVRSIIWGDGLLLSSQSQSNPKTNHCVGKAK